MPGLAGISGTLSESTEGPYSPNLFGKYINDMDKASGISKKLEELRDADIKCLQDINFEKIVSDFYGICGKLQQNKPSTTTTSSDNIDLVCIQATCPLISNIRILPKSSVSSRTWRKYSNHKE